ncbi:hypothetical protein KI387_018837, partial [Taxus chinensis]
MQVDGQIDDVGVTDGYRRWWVDELQAAPPWSGQPDLATVIVQRDALHGQVTELGVQLSHYHSSEVDTLHGAGDYPRHTVGDSAK